MKLHPRRGLETESQMGRDEWTGISARSRVGSQCTLLDDSDLGVVTVLEQFSARRDISFICTELARAIIVRWGAC